MNVEIISERIPNRKAKEVYELITRQTTVSKIDLLDQSGMTVSTLTRLLEELTSQGLILESGFGASTGGRRPILYEKNLAYAYIFGLEISRTLSKLVLVDLGMNKLESNSWDNDRGHDPRSADSFHRQGSEADVSEAQHSDL